MDEKPYNPTDPVVYTDRVQCRDCYRCLRACPVKAIRMCNDQASVVAEACIGCGSCFRECPQHAKLYRKEIATARELIESGRQVIASIAPSFAAVMQPWEVRRMASVLRKLGFAKVTETAAAAWEVSRRMAEIVQRDPDGVYVTSACPAAVKYIEDKHPATVKYLMPLASPMIAHGRMLKAEHPNAAVVFIGPCVAKKLESARPEHAGVIDAVLTFEELFGWMEETGVKMEDFEESDFDEQACGDAALYPLVGGSLKAAGIDTDMLAADVLSVSGQGEIDEALHSIAGERRKGVLIEPLFCKHGCINGPLADWGRTDSYQRRKKVLEYVNLKTGVTQQPHDDALVTRFTPAPPEAEFTEEQINEVLRRIGKVRPEDMLNCCACGYPTCRDKAIAVLKGMAELEMCIPYMRRLAEQRTDLIIDSSPNGIVILDGNLNIISMNPAFRDMFVCGEGLYGKNISWLMDPDAFERAKRGPDKTIIEGIARFANYGLVVNRIVYRLAASNQVVGIFTNMTHLIQNKKQLDSLRQQTVQKARELIDNQIDMAQKIVEFLGKSTARSEEILENLLNMDESPDVQDDAAAKNDTIARNGKWNRHIYTPK